MMELILTLIGLGSVGATALGGFFWLQGDAVFELAAERMEGVEFSCSSTEALLRFLVPVVNRGKQNGMVLDVWAQPPFLGTPVPEVLPRLRLQRENPRPDWYWEAVILKKGETLKIEGSVLFRGRDLPSLLQRIGTLNLIIHYKTIGRSSLDYRMAELSFDLKNLTEGCRKL